MRTTRLVLIILGILSVALLATGFTLYMRYTTDTTNDEDIIVIAIINYGSLNPEAQEEHNVTTQKGSTALQVFANIAELDLLNFSFGVYVKGVNGYTEQSGDYWAFYYFDFDTQSWVYSSFGVGQYKIESESKIKLEYTG